MSFSNVITVAATMAVALATGQSVSAQSQRTSVVELWYIPAGEIPQQPEVAVLSDGAVWTNNGVSQQLTQTEVQDLVTSLLRNDRLKEINSKDLASEIVTESQRTSLSWKIPNADDSMIRIRTGGKTYEVRCHAVGLLGNRFPNCECLQCFVSAQRRLENIRAVTDVGGTEAATQLAVVAQSQLEFEFGVALPITHQDLSMVRSLPDGSRYAQFLVHDSQDGGESHIVSVFQTPGATPRVSFQNHGTVVR